MSLNKLKDALQDYQNSYSECLGITPTSSAPTQGRAETNSAFPELDFKFEISDPLEINSTQVTQEKVSSAQTKIDEDILQRKHNPFSQYDENDQPHANQSNQNIQRRPRARMKKKKVSTSLLFSYCLYSSCCVVSVMQFMIFTHPRRL